MAVIRFLIIIISIWQTMANANAKQNYNDKIIRIGTGSENALAYPTVSVICDIFNKYNIYSDITCQAISTGGSEDNLNGIMSGKFDMGVIKTDMQYDAYYGSKRFKPYDKLRGVFGLHNEYLTIIAKKDADISSFADLKGKRVHIGNKGSGSRVIIDKFFRKINFDPKQEFSEIREDSLNQLHDLFYKNKIDASIYMVGHPNKIFTDILKDCNTKITSFSRVELENYVEEFGEVYLGKINKNTYKNQKYDLETYKMQLMLSTSSEVDDEIIYNFVQIVFDHQDEIKEKISTLRGVDLLGKTTHIIPFHKGAYRYYKTLDWW